MELKAVLRKDEQNRYVLIQIHHGEKKGRGLKLIKGKVEKEKLQ